MIIEISTWIIPAAITIISIAIAAFYPNEGGYL